jgi:hypothetical protein
MPAIRTDLLSNTRALLRWVLFIDVGFILLAALLLIASAWFDPSMAPTMMAGVFEDSSLTPERQLLALRLGLMGGLAASALTLPVLRWLLAIIDSARSGDPFIPENGARLRRIGWALLAIHITMAWVLPLISGTDAFSEEISLSALLTVVLVFVLARIFETGTRMRNELRETI